MERWLSQELESDPLSLEGVLQGSEFAFWPALDEGNAHVLALHGFTGHAADFGVLGEEARQTDWMAPVLPGHGGCLAGPWELGKLFRYFDHLFDLIGQGGPRVLLGYSMGGRLALHYALARPEVFSHVVLVGASPGLAGAEERAERAAEDARLAETIETIGTRAFLEQWRGRALIATQERHIDEARLRLMRSVREIHRPEGLAASLRQHGTGALPEVWSRLQELDVPVLLVNGEEDAKFGRLADRMCEHFPRAHRLIVPRAGHAAHLENPAAFARAMARWLGLASL
jgi:2-succinyl-6-hydroxy-2,4-cyclohexadiene-1-carboxylate synthase